MSAPSGKQQELIDQIISNYIKTNDNTAKQYLKLRRDALQVASTVQHEVQRNGTVSPETALQLQKLEFEKDKMAELYDAYVLRLKSNLEFSKTHKPQYLNELERQFSALSRQQEKIQADIKVLRGSTKPIVDRMKVLAENYEAAVSIKSGKKPRGVANAITKRGSKPDANSTLIDYASTVFARSELEGLLDDVNKKLGHLKTVDEINETDEPSAEAGPSINVKKYLDELLQNSRAYARVDDGTYLFDIAKSASVDVGSSTMVLEDYERAIAVLTSEIRGLVARGAEAKERWIANAKKLEVIQAVLQDADVDMDA